MNEANELDTYDFDIDLARYIIPRLKQLRTKMNHVPQTYIDRYVDEDSAMRDWLRHIDEMIVSFQDIADGTPIRELTNKGLHLFAENLEYLYE